MKIRVVFAELNVQCNITSSQCSVKIRRKFMGKTLSKIVIRSESLVFYSTQTVVYIILEQYVE